jgi:hypothetical protein
VSNTGKFPQVIDRIKIEDAGSVSVRLNSTLPITIPPGKSVDISICAIGDSIGENAARIILENACASRHLVDLLVTTNADITPPVITADKSDCGIPVTFYISDETLIDSGLDSISVDQSGTTNCDIGIKQNGDRAIVTVSIIDQFQDAKYTIIITDKAGNRRVLSDSVSGLTIKIRDLENNDISFVDFDSTGLGITKCDTIMIENTGRFPIIIPHVFMSRNLAFSIPVSQMPLILKPGEKNALAICYHPLIASNDIDTMERDTVGIYYGCSEKLIPLSGIGVQILGKTETNCDVVLRSEIVTVPGLISGPYPHPLQDHGNIDIGIHQPSQVSVKMRNAFNPVETITLHEGFMMSGSYTLSFTTEKMSSGLWSMEIMMTDGIRSIPILITK